MSRRYALRDDQWERIQDLVPGRVGHVGGTAKDNRLFVEAVLYRYRAGIPWRDLPAARAPEAPGMEKPGIVGPSRRPREPASGPGCRSTFRMPGRSG